MKTTLFEPFRKLTEDEIHVWKEKLDKIHEDFIRTLRNQGTGIRDQQKEGI